MYLDCYVDESGTHDSTGAKPGAETGIFGGIIAPRGEWAQFSFDWQAALNKYKVEYFHYYEWNEALQIARGNKEPNSKFEKNPFRDLDLNGLQNMLVELAKIAGSGNKVIVGGGVYTLLFQQAKSAGAITSNLNPYELAAREFFSSVPEIIALQKSPWKRMPITFFFEGTDDAELRNSVLSQHNFCGKKHSTFREISFCKSGFPDKLPLQAADMVVYRMRQLTSIVQKNKSPGQFPESDTHLFRSVWDHCEKQNKKRIRTQRPR